MIPVEPKAEQFLLPADGVTRPVYGADQPEYIPLPSIKLADGRVVTQWQLLKTLGFENPRKLLISSARSGGSCAVPGRGPRQRLIAPPPARSWRVRAITNRSRDAFLFDR